MKEMYPNRKSMDLSSEAGTASVLEIKVYKYRWVVLLIFCLGTVINFMQFLQFTIIASIITKYYDVNNFAVDATGLVFFIAYIVLFLPVSYLIEKYSLKITLLISIGLTLLGNVIKLGCANPNRFYVYMIGQVLCAVGQIYLLSIPSKVASVWFGPNEVSTACAIAVLGTQLGAALGSIVSPFFIKSDNDSDVEDNIFHMMLMNAIISGIVFILVAAFFKARPIFPPSQSQRQLLEFGDEIPPFVENCKKLLKNKNFLLLLLSFGMFNGLWNAFGIVVNTLYTHYFPDGEHDIGIITLSAIIAGGCIGSVIFGLILDKTHQFKRTAIGVMAATVLFYIVAQVCLSQASRIGSFIAIPFLGFFAASGLLISFEYTLEETYPVPESVSCSLMNGTIFFFAIVFALLGEGLFHAIGFFYAFVVILCLFIAAAVTMFFVKTNLRRRQANVGNSE